MMCMATILAEKNPMSDCVLTRTADLLMNDDALSVTGLIVTSENIDDYRSAVDWLLSACFPSIKPYIVAFYDDGDAPLLKDCFSCTVIEKIDNYLFSFIRLHMDA